MLLAGLPPSLRDVIYLKHFAECTFAEIGAIGDNAFDYVDVAEVAAGHLAQRYPEQLRERYIV